MLAKEGPPGLEVTDGVGIHPLMRKRIFDPLLILTAVIALLMLLVCANLAGLLLTQAVAREREIGIRVAFGATHGRIVQQLLSESLLLGLLGGVAGIVIGRGLMKLLEIVGVAGDVRESLKTGPQSLVYRPFHQLFFPNLTLHVKTAGDDAAAAALVAPIRAELARLDPTLPIARVTLLAEEMRQGSAQPLLFSQSL
jgi:ABC-type antimicrobial peptide transport system permease subunit